MLSFSILYWNLIKFLYFADTTERGTRGERESDFMDNFIRHESREKQNLSVFLNTYQNLSLTSGEFRPFLPWKLFCVGWNHIFQVKVWWIFAKKRNFASKPWLRPTVRKNNIILKVAAGVELVLGLEG
jgi:hypothetical protein